MNSFISRAGTGALVAVILVLGACSSAVQEAAPPHETFNIESKVMSETRVINVYLPPEYSAPREDAFPVLYMPDGGVHEDFPHIANTLDSKIRSGEMKPLILVGIENTERRRDMTGPTSVAKDRDVAPVVGGSADFRRFISTELIPEIHSRYRVTDESGIIGESAAGLFIVETFFLEPELFDTYIAISPSIWWNDEGLAKKAFDRLNQARDLDVDLYLTSANEADIAPQVSRLVEEIRRSGNSGVRLKYEPRPDLRHNTIYRSVAPAVMQWYYPGN